MAAFIRWNEITQIWEKAVNPDVVPPTWNHLPVANPTLPLDIANKAYVDAAAGAGFVPYNGATQNVNLGNNQLQAKNIISWAIGVSTGPTLGSYNNCNLALLEPGATFGLVWGVSSSGDSWVQSQRVDGGNAAYNLLLQPANNAGGTTGKVGIHYRDATVSYLYALLNIASGGDLWTSSGWRSAVHNANVNTLRWAGSSYHWGIGASGDSLYFLWSDSQGAGTAVRYQMIMGPNYTYFPIEINTGMIIGSGPGSFTQTGVGIGIDSSSMTAQLAVKSTAYGTQGGILAYSTVVYMGAWSNHPLYFRANNSDRMILYPSYNVEILAFLAINASANGTSPLRLGGVPTSAAGLVSGDIWTAGDGLLHIL